MAAETFRAALKNIGLASDEDHIRLSLPPGNEQLGARIVALGGRRVSGRDEAFYALAAPSRSSEARLIEALREIDSVVAAARQKFVR